MSSDLPIYVDVDDVLADTTASLIRLVRELFAKDVAYDQCHSFDLGESFGLSEGERDQLLDAAHDDGVLESMRAIEGAAEILAAWQARGNRVEIVTGRPPGTLPATRRWLDDNAIPHASVSSVDKYGRHGHLPDAVPLDALATRRFRIAVEDSLSMTRFLVEATDTPVLLLDRPWNRDVRALAPRVRARVERVRSWSEIAERLRGR